MWTLIIDNLDIKYGVLLDVLTVVGTYSGILGIAFQIEKSKYKIKPSHAIISIIIVATIFGFISYFATTGRLKAQQSEEQAQLIAHQDEMEKIHNLANAYLSNNSYLEAIKEFDKLSSDYENYISAMEQKQNAIDAYIESTLKEITNYVESGNYVLALDLLKTLKEDSLFANDPSIIASIQNQINNIQEIYAEECCALANEYWENGNINSALNTLEEANQICENNLLIESTTNNIQQAYKNYILSQAANIYSSDGYQSAISVLTDGLSVLGQDEEILVAIDEYQQKKPVYLSNLDYYKSGGEGIFYFSDSKTDNFGDEHSDVIYTLAGFSPTTSTSSQTYRINQNYNRITGTVFLSHYDRDTQYSGYIEILGDDISLFKANNITSGFEPTPFDLDISYVTDLEIRIFDPDFYGASGSRCLSNVVLYPN